MKKIRSTHTINFRDNLAPPGADERFEVAFAPKYAFVNLTSSHPRCALGRVAYGRRLIVDRIKIHELKFCV